MTHQTRKISGAAGRKGLSPAGGILPRYQQVKQHILERVGSGQWPPEARIPSENELVRRLGVSRMTVNRALRELAADRYLVRVQGVGTFVAPTKPQSALLEIRSIADEIADRGGVHDSQVMVLRAEKAAPEIARILELTPGVSVFHSLIVHRDRGVPLQLADRWVNPAVAPAYLRQDFTRFTPSRYLLETAPVSQVEHIIEAMLPDARVCRLLETDPGEPCLVLYRTTWAGPLVATYSQFTYPGARYRIGGRFQPAAAGGSATC